MIKMFIFQKRTLKLNELDVEYTANQLKKKWG